MRTTTPEPIDYSAAAPLATLRAQTLEHYLTTSFLDPKLLSLVRLRASQINGCSYCIDRYSKGSRALGETEQRLYALNARRKAPLYTDRA
jgi:AhpD family alkylhydroperoxidase